MERETKQELHEYCKNREGRKKRYEDKRKHNKECGYYDDGQRKTKKTRKEWN